MAGILNMLNAGALFGGGGLFGGQKKRGFPKILRVSDFTSAVVARAAGYVKVGSLTVPAQQERTFGFGVANTAEAGRLFMDVETPAGVDIDGTIRLAAANANETAIDVVMEIRTELVSENPTDITKQTFFPEITNYPVLGRVPREDDLMSVYMDFDTDTGDSISTTESDFRIHSTIYQ